MNHIDIIMTGFNFNLISKYRSELMGVASIGILMCHAHSYDVNLPFHLNQILSLGQIGVMIFFFLSGVGLFYSTRMFNGGLKGVGNWYRKRFVRILVPYIIVYGTTLLLQMPDNHNVLLCVGGVIYKLSTISYWFGDGGCWFICVLVPIYFLTPFWNLVLERVKYPVIPTIVLMVLLNMNIFDSFNAAFYQASFFFCGFWVARYVKSEMIVSTKCMLLIGIGIIMLLCSFLAFGFWGLLAILLAPVVWLFCLLFDKCNKTFINRIFSFLGEISLESYLFNGTLIVWINHFHMLPDSMYSYRYIFIVVFGVLLSWGVNRICKPIIMKLSQ